MLRLGLNRLAGGAFPRYLIASVLALGVDLGAFLLLLRLGSAAAPASAASYALGIAAHWLLSSRSVFSASVAASGPARTRQKVLFVVTALVGLGLTTLTVSLGAAVGLDPRLAKLVAVVVSFAATWWLRRSFVFKAEFA